MRNFDIKNLHQEVPKEIRLEVYKEVLEIIETGKPKCGMSTFGLCILLPCILWDIQFLTEAPDGDDWDFEDTPKAFPELNDGVLSLLDDLFSDEEKIVVRVEFLKDWIKQLSHEKSSNPL